MLIATNVIDYDKVLSLSEDEEGLCAYIKSLVPERYRHVDAIYHNTRYYINLEVLKNSTYPLEKKLALSRMLTKNIRTVGYMDSYVTCSELEAHISMKKVHKYHEGELYGKGS